MNVRIPKIVFLYLAVGLILLVVIVIIVINLFSGDKNNLPPTSPTITPVSTRQEDQVILRNGSSSIKTESVFPLPATQKETLQNPSQKITFTLNEDVPPENIAVSISPSLPIKIEQGDTPDKILVFPDPPEFWVPNVRYTLTLRDNENTIISQYTIEFPKATFPEVRD